MNRTCPLAGWLVLFAALHGCGRAPSGAVDETRADAAGADVTSGGTPSTGSGGGAGQLGGGAGADGNGDAFVPDGPDAASQGGAGSGCDPRDCPIHPPCVSCCAGDLCGIRVARDKCVVPLGSVVCEGNGGAAAFGGTSGWGGTWPWGGTSGASAGVAGVDAGDASDAASEQ